MVRLFFLLLAIGSGFYLYHVRRDADALDREMGRLTTAVSDSHSQVLTLQAEYKVLTEPHRLQELAVSLPSLRPTAPSQISDLTGLQRHLPPTGKPAGTGAAP